MCYSCGCYPCVYQSGEVQVVYTGAPGETGPTGATGPTGPTGPAGGNMGDIVYEEDVFVPQFSVNGDPTGVAQTGEAGWWRRIGNMLFVYGRLQVTNLGSGSATGTAMVTFTAVPYLTTAPVPQYLEVNFTIPAGIVSGLMVKLKLATASINLSFFTQDDNPSGAEVVVQKQHLSVPFQMSFQGAFIIDVP